MKVKERLNAPEQDFAAANHSLVYSFLANKHLPEDQYYDVVVFGYLDAVRKYCRMPELRKRSFAGLAFRCMYWTYCNHIKSETMQKRQGRALSLDAPAAQDIDCPLGDFIAGGSSDYSEIIYNDILERVSSRISPKQKQVLELRAKGYRVGEISVYMQVAPVVIERLLYQIRGRVTTKCVF